MKFLQLCKSAIIENLSADSQNGECSELEIYSDCLSPRVLSSRRQVQVVEPELWFVAGF